MNVLIAGGGTGGHLFPGIAVAEELLRRDPSTRVVFVGTARGVETRAVPRAGFPLELLPVSGLRRQGVLHTLRGLLRLPVAMLGAVALVRRHAPQVAVSVGGYAAGPAVLTAKLLGVPSVVMEQNARPGVTNRVLGCFADRICAALPTSCFPSRKVVVVGNPVRAEIRAVREDSYSPSTDFRLLIFGGSQGARALNDVCIELASRFAASSWQIVHQTGNADLERVCAAYADAGATVRVFSFIDDMAGAYRDADLVVCRAGASTLAELTVCGRPGILVPYPFAVDDHQSANAAVVAEAGGAVHLPQRELSASRLWEEITRLAGDRDRLRTMARAARRQGHPDSVGEIANALEEVAGV